MAKENPETTLLSVARKLHATPTQGSDRTCLVHMPDGTTRLAVTQISKQQNYSSLHSGAIFYRVSFRFAGPENDSANQFHAEQDVAWCILDPRTGNALFGPAEGIQIRHPGLGIGSYLLGQLIRLVLLEDARVRYSVLDMNLPVKAQGIVAESNEGANNAAIKAMYERAGFYVSDAAGRTVIGARRLQDLKAWWNQDKVKFLQFPQFIELAAGWHRGAGGDQKAVDNALAAAHRDAAQLRTELERAAERVTSLEAAIAEGTAVAGEQEERFARVTRQHEEELQHANGLVADLKSQLASKDAEISAADGDRVQLSLLQAQLEEAKDSHRASVDKFAAESAGHGEEVRRLEMLIAALKEGNAEQARQIDILGEEARVREQQVRVLEEGLLEQLGELQERLTTQASDFENKAGEQAADHRDQVRELHQQVDDLNEQLDDALSDLKWAKSLPADSNHQYTLHLSKPVRGLAWAGLGLGLVAVIGAFISH